MFVIELMQACNALVTEISYAILYVGGLRNIDGRDLLRDGGIFLEGFSIAFLLQWILG